MNDFLRGTLGKLAQIVLTLLGFLLLFSGFFSCALSNSGNSGVSIFLVILGIVCFCAVFGIRYWLGSINRLR